MCLREKISMKKDFKSEDLLTFSSLSYTGNESVDAFVHTSGGSLYIDDLNEPKGMLHGYVFYIPVAHAKITSIDLSKALNCSSVHRILTAKDIPGENQIGGFIKDEPLLAEGGVHYWGQPLALILAEDLREAKKAAKLIEVVYEPLNVIVDPREAVKKNSFLIPPKTIIRGEAEQVFGECDHVIEGTATSGGQEHLYLEGQGALAIPRENGLLKIYSSTQGPTIVQSVIARVLNIKMHQVEVEVGRLGGGFGGKEDQATPWATLAALACLLTQKPVKIVLDRSDDMRMTGKRHPYEYDYKIGLNHAAKILAYEITFYQNGGSAADLSPAVLSRSIFHACNAYHVPNVKITAYSCKTNLPPNTAFRGFGAPQAIFAVECAIRKASEKINVAPEIIQKENLLKDGDCFHYGQKVERSLLGKCWEQLESDFNVDQMISKVKIFNQNITRTKKFFNQAISC